MRWSVYLVSSVCSDSAYELNRFYCLIHVNLFRKCSVKILRRDFTIKNQFIIRNQQPAKSSPHPINC